MKLVLKYSRIIIVLFVVVFSTYTRSFAQCNTVVKEGITKLDPYSFNGQINAAKINDKNPLEIHIVFYKGYNYKIQINCELWYADKIAFKVLDANKNEIYNSSKSEVKDSWTFFSNSVQELIIVTSSEVDKKHCVSVLVGMKTPKNNNSMRYL